MINYRMPSWAELKRHRFPLALALAAFVVLILFHSIWVSPIMSEKESLQSQVDQQKELIRKYNEKLDQAQSIRENLTKQENELRGLQQRLFQGKDPYQLAASLGDLFASKEGPKLDIKTYQVLASKEYGLYREVHLRFNFMSNIDGLHHFLERLKSFPAAVLVREMNIQRIHRRSGPDLVVNVILAALMEKGEK